MTLKSDTLTGFKWSFVDTISKYMLTFVIGIILARLLSPSDYGLVGISAIFIGVSRVFIDGGFSDSLIRKTKCTIEDYSTVFFFNMTLAILFYVILFFSAKGISIFFNQEQLVIIIRVTGLGLIIGATASIQSVTLRKRMDFRLQMIIGFISTIFSGSIAIIMALKGFGVWSLIYSGIFQGITSSILLWILNKVHIKLIFKSSIIREHFNFGSKIMFGSFILIIYNNMYYALVGKFFNPATLGYYTKADNFQRLISENIDTVVRQVTYPVLSKMQDDQDKLKSSYRILIRTTFFIVFILLSGLSLVAKSFIVILIGEKWLPSVPFLQLLCFVGVFYPLISINGNVLNVKGRSDLTLKITILKLLLSVPALLLGYYFGIYIMIFGMLFSVIITYTTIMYFTKYILNYTINEQLRDIWPTIKIVFCAFTPLFFLQQFIVLSIFSMLIIQILLAFFMIILFGEILKNNEYIFIRNFLKSKLIL